MYYFADIYLYGIFYTIIYIFYVCLVLLLNNSFYFLGCIFVFLIIRILKFCLKH